jgi:hypothetical protein
MAFRSRCQRRLLHVKAHRMCLLTWQNTPLVSALVLCRLLIWGFSGTAQAVRLYVSANRPEGLRPSAIRPKLRPEEALVLCQLLIIA